MLFIVVILIVLWKIISFVNGIKKGLKINMKETELAQDMINYLDGKDLYFEVLDVDIIVKEGIILTAIETKLNLNFKVIEQACRNKENFHYSYIAVPWTKNRTFAEKICNDYGIGLIVLEYAQHNGKLRDIRERIKPTLNRHAFTKHIILTDEDKKSIPGASGKDGTTRTAFKITVETIEDYVIRHEGCTLKELFNNINHHYYSLSSAISSTYTYLRSGVLKNVELRQGKLFSIK